jgi:hypothetical protein
MRPLSRGARSILSASEQEPLPSAEVLGRMRRTVLARVAGAGGALLVGASVSANAGAALGTGLSAKIGAAFSGTLVQVVGSGLVGAFAAAAVLTATHVWPALPSLVDRPTDRATTEPSIIAPHVAGSRPATRTEPEAPSQPAARSEPRSRAPIEALAREPASGFPPQASSPTRASPTPPRAVTSMATVDVLTGESPPLRAGTTSPRSSPSTGRHSASAAPSELGTMGQDPPMGSDPPAPSGEAPSKDDLSRQLQVLRAVRALLRDQQPMRVLELLNQPALLTEGPFEEELRTARIAALCRLGRQGEARHEIAAFLQRWPRSPLSGRLRAGCSIQEPE